MKQVLIIIITIFLSLTSFSQDSLKHQAIEINIGMNQLIGNSELLPKPGFGVSLKYLWFTDSRINLVSGLLFEKTRYLDKYSPCVGFSCYLEDMKYDIYSFSIPLLIRANTGKKIRLFIETGPTFEFIPSKYGKGTEVSFFPPNSWSRKEVSGDFQHVLVDFGAIAGIGIMFPVNNYKFVVSSLYHDSFKSIFDKQYNELTAYFSVKLGVVID